MFVGEVGNFIVVDGIRLPYLLIQVNEAVYEGWYFQLFTSLFIAIPGILGVADVFFNAAAVIWLDTLLSGALRPREYYAVFLLSGLGGNLVSLLNGPLYASFGASGGIFGLLASAIALEFVAQRRIDFALGGWFLAVFLFSSFALPSVDALGHLGGAVFGLAAGAILGLLRGKQGMMSDTI